MAMRILTQPGDMDLVRVLAFSAEIPAIAVQELTDATIQSDPIGGRAESQIIDYLDAPADLALILAGTAPTQYANASAVSALIYLRSATFYLICAYCVPILQQLVATREERGEDRVIRDLTWSVVEAEWLGRAKGSLTALIPVTFFPGLTAVRAILPPIDPLSTQRSSYGIPWILPTRYYGP